MINEGISKNQIKYIRSLAQKKFRQRYNNFVVEGDKMAIEILAHPYIKIEAIYAIPQWIKTNLSKLSVSNTTIFSISLTELKGISNLKTPNQVLIIAKQPVFSVSTAQLAGQFCLYLEDIQDPGNLGTILRTADWFGIEYVFCSQNTVDLYNAKVIQATMGAFLRTKVIYIDWHTLKESYFSTDYPVIGTLLNGQSIYNINTKPTSGVVIMGNEAKGISESLQKEINYKLLIPPGKVIEHAESLNVGVATGIICAWLKDNA